MSNIYKWVLDLSRNPSFWNEIEWVQEKALLSKWDIVLTLTWTIWKRDYWYSVQIQENNKFLLNQRLLRIKGDDNMSLSDFLYRLIWWERFLYNFFSESKWGTWNQTNVSTEDIKRIKISLPQLPEQQKIADFLSIVDEKIQSLEEKKSSLQEYKKWMMRKIFSQEVRFTGDDGESFGDWEEKRLGEICKKQSSNISMNTLDENNGDYKLYWATGFLKNIDFYQEENDYVSIVKDWAWVWRVLYCKWMSSVLWTLDKIKPKEWTDLYFLLLLLRRINFWNYTVWSTIPHIYFRDYSRKKILFPSLPEQQKIADFLSGLDKKIESVESEIESAKEWKKGLLQGMFV